MSLFTSLRRQHLSNTDEKDHDSDSDDAQQNTTRTPLLSSSSPLFTEHNSQSNESSFFSLRIKLNDGTQPNNSSDFVLEDISPGVTTVRELKGAILKKHSNSSDDGTSNNGNENNDNNSGNRYLRLIVRGRMMAPDTSTLDKFSITKNDVIHAILAKEGTRGGQQARMLRRLNKSSPNNNGVGGGDATSGSATVSGATGGRASTSSAGGNTNNNSLSNRLLRRIGIDSNGIVISLTSNSNEDEDSDESEDDESEDEGDVEMGNTTSRPPTRRRGQRERRQRERRGFDRLRSTGMTRDEVTAIRLYFARSIDRYIERRRAMIRAARQMMVGAASNNNNEGGASTSSSTSRRGSSSGESNNSLIETDEETGTSTASTTTSTTPGAAADISTTNNSSSNNNDEEILTDRRRMEDEWMSTQGPYSEFRMKLNTSNPLLLAAISGGAANVTEDAAAAMRLNAAMGINPNGSRGGLFFRRAAAAVNAAAVALEVDDEQEEEEEEEDDLMFGGTLNPNGTYVPQAGVHPLYMGPLPSAGTEKDFVWGFILGFFVGFIMLFWVWMPTVTHKQKVGIILGICFQLGMSLMLKNNVHAHI
ncbi:hypothetical protein QTG54_010108 [Skeletonema marinoi]|uniref:DSC E3 ubiquitin ligase complex subunit 3 C-terminal domain-containing protein n=1 Tax=Skeletonema marinoi TaxID=267567 RepID=A0AAD8Y6M0_9STRA|nr:hypothetical protein QTG54_010108 [Skeletonema marinoi]